MAGPEPQLLPCRTPQLRGGDVAVLPHRLQHLVAAGESGARVRERIVDRRRLRQAGEQRRLHERQLVRVLGEVRARGRLRAVRMVPVEDLVQVVGEDLLPRVMLEVLRGETGLRDLARDCPLVGADVEVPHQLLGDRRAALHDLAVRDVLVDRASNALVVERSVLPEAGVLDRDRRLRQRRRDLRERQPLAVRRRGHDPEALPVVRVEERILAERERTQVMAAARREQELAAREGDGGEQERRHRGEQQRQHEQDAAALPVAAAQPPMAREQDALELEIVARRPPTLRPSSVTTRVTCHSSAIVLETPGGQTGQSASVRR